MKSFNELNREYENLKEREYQDTLEEARREDEMSDLYEKLCDDSGHRE